MFHLTNLGFIYLFLPLSAAVYYCMPRRAKVPALLFISLGFYLLAQPQTLWMLAAALVVDYAAARGMQAADRRPGIRKFLMLFVVFKNAGVILTSSIYAQLSGTQMPLGLAVYSFTAIGYLVDIYRREEEYEENFFCFAVFGLLYFKLFTGPLVRYSELREQLRNPRPSLTRIADGAVLFVQGAAKRLIIGQNMENLYLQLRAIGLQEHTVLSAWLLPLSLAFSVVFTLSGYCDMARGIAGIYSLELPRNFYYPFLASSVTDFTGRFNITVRRFFETYVYNPLGGSTRGGISTLLNMTLLMLLWGSWFGYSVNYILWGLYFTLFLLLEEWVLAKYLVRIPTFFARMYTYIAVMMSFVIFAGNTLRQTFGYYRVMFGATGAALYDDRVLYLLVTNYVVLLLAFLFSTSLVRKLQAFIKGKCRPAAAVLSLLINTALLILVTIFRVV